jgi:hypothetical protein
MLSGNRGGSGNSVMGRERCSNVDLAMFGSPPVFCFLLLQPGDGSLEPLRKSGFQFFLRA